MRIVLLGGAKDGEELRISTLPLRLRVPVLDGTYFLEGQRHSIEEYRCTDAVDTQGRRIYKLAR